MKIVFVCMLLLSAVLLIGGAPGDVSVGVGLAVFAIALMIVRWLWRSAQVGGSNQVARDAGVAAAAARDKASSLAKSFKDGFDRK